MKYLKIFESIFFDNREKVSKFIDTFDDKFNKIQKEKDDLKSKIDDLDNEHRKIQHDIKVEIDKVDAEYLDEINSYMIDVEDFDVEFKYYPINKLNENMCSFQYTFNYDSFMIFEDLIFKLESLLNKEKIRAFSVSYHSDKGSISLENIHKTKPNIIKIVFMFKRIKKYPHYYLNY